MHRMLTSLGLIALLLLCITEAHASDPASSSSVKDPAIQAAIDKLKDQTALSNAAAAAHTAEASEKEAKLHALEAGLPTDKPSYPAGDITIDQNSGNLGIWAGGLAIHAAAWKIGIEIKKDLHTDSSHQANDSSHQAKPAEIWLMKWSDYQNAMAIADMAESYRVAVTSTLCDQELKVSNLKGANFSADPSCQKLPKFVAESIPVAIGLVNAGLDGVLNIASKFNANVQYVAGPSNSVSSDDLYDAIIQEVPAGTASFSEAPGVSDGGANQAAEYSGILDRANRDVAAIRKVKSDMLDQAKKDGDKNLDTSVLDEAISRISQISDDLNSSIGKGGGVLGSLQGVIVATSISRSAREGGISSALKDNLYILDVGIQSQATSLASYKKAFGARKIMYVSSLVSHYRLEKVGGGIISAGTVAVTCEVTHAVGDKFSPPVIHGNVKDNINCSAE